MSESIHALGPVLGLCAAFWMIGRKVPPFPALLAGAIAGGLLGGGGIAGTAAAMYRGEIGMLSSIACILASGILAGALMQTGAAQRIALTVLERLGKKWCLAAIALSVLLLTAAGVFVDIAVITAAPIALTLGSRAGKSKAAILLAMIGGGKAGNIISPNPNTLAAAKSFGLELTDVMGANLIPAAAALAVTVLLASALRGEAAEPEASGERTLPSLAAALSGPGTVLGLLALRPVCGIAIDPVIVLPVGGLVCILATGNQKQAAQIALFGLREVFGVALVLAGTGMIAGILQTSDFQELVIRMLNMCSIPPVALAPLAGILMGGAAASTTAGTAMASQAFGTVLLDAGIPPLSAAAMIHAGAVVLDSLPHGSFFHATAGCVGMDSSRRLKLVVFEALIGLSATIAAVCCNV